MISRYLCAVCREIQARPLDAEICSSCRDRQQPGWVWSRDACSRCGSPSGTMMPRSVPTGWCMACEGVKRAEAIRRVPSTLRYVVGEEFDSSQRFSAREAAAVQPVAQAIVDRLPWRPPSMPEVLAATSVEPWQALATRGDVASLAAVTLRLARAAAEAIERATGVRDADLDLVVQDVEQAVDRLGTTGEVER